MNHVFEGQWPIINLHQMFYTAGKLVVHIPDICGHGPGLNTVVSWVEAGYCVLQCNYRSPSLPTSTV